MFTIDKNIQEKICSLLNHSEEQYAKIIYNTGIEYLQALMPEYPQISKEISSSKIFWNWWKMHWQKRDEEFIECWGGYHLSTVLATELYAEFNNASILAKAIYLNGMVLQESYANLISDITKNQVYA